MVTHWKLHKFIIHVTLCITNPQNSEKHIVLPENKNDRSIHNQTIFVEVIGSMSNILRAALLKKGSPAPGQCVCVSVSVCVSVCGGGGTQLFRNGKGYGKNRCGFKLKSSLLFQNAHTVCTHTVPHIVSCHYTHTHTHTHTSKTSKRGHRN